MLSGVPGVAGRSDADGRFAVAESRLPFGKPPRPALVLEELVLHFSEDRQQLRLEFACSCRICGINNGAGTVVQQRVAVWGDELDLAVSDFAEVVEKW